MSDMAIRSATHDLCSIWKNASPVCWNRRNSVRSSEDFQLRMSPQEYGTPKDF
jgi:hypothetical protein